jgi:hypothetical protein
MAEKHGMYGKVYIGGSVIKLTRSALNNATDRVEVSGFQDFAKYYVQGKRDMTGDISGFWDSASDDLFEAAESSTPVPMVIYPDFTTTPTKYWYGLAWVDASLDMDSNGAVAVSGSWAAAATWTRAF